MNSVSTPYTLPREKRLRSKKLIENLFAGAKVIHNYPISLFWMPVDEPDATPVRFIVNASRRKWKRAHDRNLLKRRMREVMRLQLPLFEESLRKSGQGMVMALVYTGCAIIEYAAVRDKIILLLRRLLEENEKTPRKADDTAD